MVTFSGVRECFKDVMLISARSGPLEGVNYLLKKIWAKISRKEVLVYKCDETLNFPIFLRLNSSDPIVYADIFKWNGFEPLKDIKDVQFIVDCGGYVGYSSIWFIRNFPSAHVTVVEPDPDNYLLCKKNLAPYGQNVDLINAAIWPHKKEIVVCKGENSYWSTQVREAKSGESKAETTLSSVDLCTLIKESRFSKIDILKIDIEGSEKALFDHQAEMWLDNVKNLSIEFHSKECEESVFAVLKKYNYEMIKCRELVVFKNISRKA